MYVTAFVGSRRRGGNTDILVKEALEAAQQKGATTKVHYLDEYKIEECMGCDQCKVVKHCVIEDDVAHLYDEIFRASGIVIGSPIYMSWITGTAKTFIDRWYALVDFQDGQYRARYERDKKVAFIFPYEAPDDHEYDYVAEKHRQIMKTKPVAEVKVLLVPRVREKGDVSKHDWCLQEAAKIGEWIAAPIEEPVSE